MKQTIRVKIRLYHSITRLIDILCIWGVICWPIHDYVCFIDNISVVTTNKHIANAAIRLANQDIIVKAHAKQQEYETTQLQSLEWLPTNRQRENPNDHCTNGIQNHASRGWNLFSHTDAGIVEKCNRNDCSQNGH